MGHGRYTGEHPLYWISDKPDGSIDAASSKDRLPGPKDDIDMVYINDKWHKIKTGSVLLTQFPEGDYGTWIDGSFYPIDKHPPGWNAIDYIKKFGDVPPEGVPAQYVNGVCKWFKIPCADD